MGDYRRPASLDGALHLLSLERHRILAGGTDLFPADAAHHAWGDPTLSSARVLDVSALAELRGIETSPHSVRFGGATTWREVATAPLPAAFEGLRAAARDIGGRQVQNRGTLGGNLCNASPAADGVPPLLTLDAVVELASVRGARRLPLVDFVLGNRRTALAPDELLVAIHVPAPPSGARGGFAKLGARRHLVISIAMVAAVVGLGADGRIALARIAVGACAPVARRLPALERALIGQVLAEAPRTLRCEHFAALTPIDDVRASASYRMAAARTLVARCLAHLGHEAAAA